MAGILPATPVAPLSPNCATPGYFAALQQFPLHFAEDGLE
jgi:hypothetical protein